MSTGDADMSTADDGMLFMDAHSEVGMDDATEQGETQISVYSPAVWDGILEERPVLGDLRQALQQTNHFAPQVLDGAVVEKLNRHIVWADAHD